MARGTTRSERGSAILMAAVAAMAAALGARASLLSSTASNDWHRAVRIQLAQAESIRDGLDQVYGTEVPQAIDVTAARLRGDTSLADRLAADAAPLARDPRYQTQVGIDVVRRLADVRAGRGSQSPGPSDSQRAGDGRMTLAVHVVATTIPVSVAFLFGALAVGFPTWRRRFVVIGAACLVIALIAFVAVEAMA